MKKYNLNKKIVYIGNSIADKIAAKNAGIRFYQKENKSLLDQIKQNIKHFRKLMISVITPILNGEKFLHETYLSIKKIFIFRSDCDRWR